MNNEFFQQAERLFKPVTDVMALNARTLEVLAEKQTGLMSDVWTDGMRFAKDLSDKRDAQAFYASQREFLESLSDKFNSTARDSYQVLTEAQEEMGKLMQDSISTVDFPAAAEPFVKTAYRAQEAAESTAQSSAKSAHKAQAQAGKSATRAAEKAASKAAGGSS